MMNTMQQVEQPKEHESHLALWTRTSKGTTYPRKIREGDEKTTFTFHDDAIWVGATSYHGGDKDCGGESSHDYDEQTGGKGVRGDHGSGTITPDQAAVLRDSLTEWLMAMDHPKAVPASEILVGDEARITKAIALLDFVNAKGRREGTRGYHVDAARGQLQAAMEA